MQGPGQAGEGQAEGELSCLPVSEAEKEFHDKVWTWNLTAVPKRTWGTLPGSRSSLELSFLICKMA